jgi:hypothetical protein
MVSKKLKALSWCIQSIKNCQKYIKNEKIMVPQSRGVKNLKRKFLKTYGINNQIVNHSLDIVMLPLVIKNDM